MPYAVLPARARAGGERTPPGGLHCWLSSKQLGACCPPFPSPRQLYSSCFYSISNILCFYVFMRFPPSFLRFPAERRYADPGIKSPPVGVGRERG